ncbi:MAG: hypothetical protein E7612_07755 [Ruminococcaceae bacterium]|nr:hypothetical protein [Oscillospiraceae bacterium]
MIVRRKLTKFPPESLPLNEKGKHLSLVGADELVVETYEFLKTFYKGCFDAYLTRFGYKSIFICIENFAIVIKSLVKAVFARELIVIRFSENADAISMDWEFDTSVISDELRKEIKTLANEGGFDITFDDKSAHIEIEFMPNSVPYVNSITTRIVYNTLVYVFNNKQL